MAGSRTGFTVLPEPVAGPEAFTFGALTITPSDVDPGDEATVSVTITNTADIAGTIEIPLNLNGTAIETTSVSLEGGESTVVTFTVTSGETGKNVVQVGDRLGTFTVRGEEIREEPAPLPHAEYTAPPQQTATATPVAPTDAGDGGILLAVIAGIAGCLIVAAGIILWRRRHGTQSHENPPDAS